MLSKRRSTSTQKLSSLYIKNDTIKQRDRALSEMKYSKQIIKENYESQLILLKQINSCKDIEDITMSQIRPNEEIDSLL